MKIRFVQVRNPLPTTKGITHQNLRWYFWDTHSLLEPMKEAAYTIKRHWDGILRWFTSKINNGILEGINSLIQAAKDKARGYRTMKNLITMICLIGGKLEFRLPT